MATASIDRIVGLNEYFTPSEARVDRWRTLNRIAKARAGTGPYRAGGAAHEPKELLAELEPLQRISAALVSNGYRDDVEAWKSDVELLKADALRQPASS